MKTDTYWTVYNEIDECIYDGTPLFDNKQDAIDWYGGQPFIFRPSSKIAKITVVVEELEDAVFPEE